MKTKRFLPLLLILALFLLTRLYNIKIIPIFTDEAIYSYWSQIALNDPQNRYASLEDGKQPLFTWFAAISQKFIEDPLVASRMVSVFAGLGSLVGIYLLAKTLFNSKVALLSSLAYTLLPFTLVYDRLALFDSLLTMFGIYSVFLTLLIAKNPRLDFALLNGAAIGLGLITKSTMVFFLYLLPISLLLFPLKAKKKTLLFTKWLGLTALTVVIAQLIYNSLRLAPLFYQIERKNLEFIRSTQAVIKNPFEHFSSNLNSIIGWQIEYNGLPFMLIAAAALIFAMFKKDLKVAFLSVYVATPLFAEVFFNKVLYPRFALFFFPYIIILFAYAIYQFSAVKKIPRLSIFLLLVSLIIPVFTSFNLLTNPKKANIATSDKAQFIESWPAGYGVEEVVAYLKEEAKDKEVIVGTEGTFGLLPFALQIYFFGSKNVEITGYWPVQELPAQITTSAKTNTTFFVFNENQNPPTSNNLKLIAKYQKGNANSFMHFYQVIP